MKRDLGRYFGTAAQSLTVLEVGGHHGHTTRVLSGLFGRVVTSVLGVLHLGANVPKGLHQLNCADCNASSRGQFG